MGIAAEASQQYIDHHVRSMPVYLGHKGPTRMAAAIDRAREYATTELPKIIVGRECLRSMYDGDYD